MLLGSKWSYRLIVRTQRMNHLRGGILMLCWIHHPLAPCNHGSQNKGTIPPSTWYNLKKRGLAGIWIFPMASYVARMSGVLCVCMCVCVCACACVCVCMCVCARVHVGMCVCVCMCECVSACMCVHMRVCVWNWICEKVQVHEIEVLIVTLLFINKISNLYS